MLKGKTAIVTGAATGIGFEIAKVFCENGAYVYIADIDIAKAQKAKKKIESLHPQRSVAVELDVSNEKNVREVFGQVIAERGQLDILVNNASIHRAYRIIEFPVDEWKQVFNINATGVFVCSKEAAKYMIKQKSGVMICISACSARKADDMHAAYSSSKAAQIEFNRILALELGKYGIRTNCILPGATETNMLKRVFKDVPGLKESIISKTTLGKLGTPRDQANAALFLASDLSSHITGEYIVVSGGEFYNP